MKRTKQGVRDLSDIPSKPRGVVLDPRPQSQEICRHVRTRRLDSGDESCLDCPLVWDWNGMPYPSYYP